MRTVHLITAVVSFTLSWRSLAFGGGDPRPQGYLSIRCAERGAVAVVDTNNFFVVPADSVKLSAGKHFLRVQRGSQWNATLVETLLTVAPDSLSLVSIPEKYTYVILSEPSGARVTIKEKNVGVTPVRITADLPLSLPLALSLPHYQEMTLDPPFRQVTRADLQPDGPSPPRGGFADFHSIRTSREWIYGTMAGSILAGTISAFAKNKANSDHDAYLSTGDTSLRDKANTLDIVAGVTLFVSEVSFGVLSYLLLAQ